MQYVRRDLTGEGSDHGLVVGGETQITDVLSVRFVPFLNEDDETP